MALAILFGMLAMGVFSFGLGYYAANTVRSKELKALRMLVRMIDRTAAHHETLGEPFAVIARDMIGTHEQQQNHSDRIRNTKN